ncbi:MAG: RNA 2'-phosphotransferase [Caldilineaceae bacterium]
MDAKIIKISKFLSYVLRHNPDAIGLKLDSAGWAAVDELLTCAAHDGQQITLELLNEVVATNDKKRFALSVDGKYIRASQGHSIRVDLELEPVEPPEQLFHGTATRFLASIQQSGLQPRNRHHVHLSSDHETAIKVGQRHGKPVILEVDARRMVADGHLFYRSENGVWLTEKVPPAYFTILESQKSIKSVDPNSQNLSEEK